MNPNLRRALLIAGFILLVFGFFAAIWFVFFRGGAPLTGTNQQVTNGGLPTPSEGNINRTPPVSNVNALPNINVPTTAPDQIASERNTLTTPVSANPAAVPFVNLNSNNLQYYDRTTGKFYSISPDGSVKDVLSDATYPDVQSITWAPSGNQAVLGFPDGSKILYDFTKKKQTTLPSELNDFSFSPDSGQLAAKYLDPQDTENQWLVVSKPDGTQSQSAEHLGANADKVTVAWSPNNQIIASYSKSINADQQQIIFLGANNENFPSVNVNGRGFTPNWSPDGRKVLYSIYSPLTNDNPHLFIMNGSPESLGTNILDLGLTTTADKCSFASSGQTIYCGVPYYMNPGSGPDPSLSNGIPDNIYKIDMRTGAVTLIARPVDQNNNQRFSVRNIQVAADESSLFFTDGVTGTLQKVRLR